MRRAETTAERTRGAGGWRRVALLVIALAALVALFALLGFTHLLMPEVGDEGGLAELREAINRIKGPATAVFISLSGLGLLAGGAMAAMGVQQGIRIMLTAGLAGGGVLLGNGLVA